MTEYIAVVNTDVHTDAHTDNVTVHVCKTVSIQYVHVHTMEDGNSG